MGAVSDDLCAAITSEAETAGQAEGLVAQMDAIADALAAVDDALDEIRAVRWRAVAQLRREGWSYDRIAMASSLSESRVKQLLGEAVEHGLLEAEDNARNRGGAVRGQRRPPIARTVSSSADESVLSVAAPSTAPPPIWRSGAFVVAARVTGTAVSIHTGLLAWRYAGLG